MVPVHLPQFNSFLGVYKTAFGKGFVSFSTFFHRKFLHFFPSHKSKTSQIVSLSVNIWICFWWCICKTQPKLLQILRRQCCLNIINRECRLQRIWGFQRAGEFKVFEDFRGNWWTIHFELRFCGWNNDLVVNDKNDEVVFIFVNLGVCNTQPTQIQNTRSDYKINF